MSALLEKHKQSRDYDNYLSFYENVLKIEEDVLRPHPKFAFNFNFMEFKAKIDKIYTLFKENYKIGYYNKDLKKFQITLTSDQIGLVIAEVIRGKQLINTNKTGISQLITKDFCNHKSTKLNETTIKKAISYYKNKDRIFVSCNKKAINLFTDYLKAKEIIE